MSDPAAVHKLHESRFKLTEHVSNYWSVVPEDGTPFEEILRPEYWVHVANRLRPTDHIEINAENGSYYAELIVRSCGRMFANVAVLRKIELEATAEVTANDFNVVLKGPQAKWSVERIRDKTRLVSGLDSKEAALSWLALNATSLAA